MNTERSVPHSNDIEEIKIISDYRNDKDSGKVKKEYQQYLKDTCETEEVKHEEIEEESFSDAPFLMTVEIGNTESKKLKIYHDSIPEEIAFEFCKKHNLDFLANEYLVKEIKKILQQENNFNKNDYENKINFSETIQEVDEEYVNSDLNRKVSCDKGKGYDNIEDTSSNRKDILLLNDKWFCSGEKEENGKSKISNSPFMNDNNMNKGEYCYFDIFNKKKSNKGTSKESISQKSKSAKTFNSVRKSQNLIENVASCKEGRLKSDFELRCEKIKRLRDIKSCFSNIFTNQFLIPPPIYDFSILKNRILSSSNILDKSTNYTRDKMDVLYKLKEKFKSNKGNINFSPKINRSSQYILRENINLNSDQKRPNVFSNLYELAKKRSERLALLRNEFNSQFNYVPIINNNFTITSSFDERQKAFTKRVEENKKKLDKELYTGLENSLSAKSRLGSKERRDLNVHEMLYTKGQNSLLSKEKKEKDFLNQICVNSNKIFTTPITKSILITQKNEAFKKLFSLIDADQDKEISIHNIDLTRCPENIKSLINPIILLMASRRITLNEDRFYSELEKIFKNLNYEKQKMLLNFTKKVVLETKTTKFDQRVNLKYRIYSTKVGNSLTSSKTSSKSIIDFMTKRANNDLKLK